MILIPDVVYYSLSVICDTMTENLMVRAYKWIVFTSPPPPPPPDTHPPLCAGMIILKIVGSKGKKKKNPMEEEYLSIFLGGWGGAVWWIGMTFYAV